MGKLTAARIAEIRVFVTRAYEDDLGGPSAINELPNACDELLDHIDALEAELAAAKQAPVYRRPTCTVCFGSGVAPIGVSTTTHSKCSWCNGWGRMFVADDHGNIAADAQLPDPPVAPAEAPGSATEETLITPAAIKESAPDLNSAGAADVCATCEGRGIKTTAVNVRGTPVPFTEAPCPVCQGSGVFGVDDSAHECRDCNGTGKAGTQRGGRAG